MTNKERKKTIQSHLKSFGYSKLRIKKYFKRKPNVFFKSEVEEDRLKNLI